MATILWRLLWQFLIYRMPVVDCCNKIPRRGQADKCRLFRLDQDENDVSEQQLILSPEETKLILERRAEQAAREEAVAFRRKAIATAHAFAGWSEEPGYTLTFSTFVNQFSYQEDDGKKMYEAVERIFEAALPQ